MLCLFFPLHAPERPTDADVGGPSLADSITCDRKRRFASAYQHRMSSKHDTRGARSANTTPTHLFDPLFTLGFPRVQVPSTVDFHPPLVFYAPLLIAGEPSVVLQSDDDEGLECDARPDMSGDRSRSSLVRSSRAPPLGVSRVVVRTRPFLLRRIFCAEAKAFSFSFFSR